MSLQTRLSDLITSIGTDYKQIRSWITGSSSGDLTGLTTVTKASLVAAVNEVNAKPSSNITQDDLDALKADILNGAPGALDTLKELADALGDDANFAATITNALALKENAADIGDANVDLAALYTTAKA